MKKFIVALTIVIAVLAIAVPKGETQQPNKVGEFMRVKLRHAQNILEGLAIEDFTMIAKNAQEISLLSHAAAWNVLQTDEYAKQSDEFRRTADALTKAAKDKNLDEATLKYVDLTMKCINCHKYMRKVRLTDASTIDTFVSINAIESGQ